MRSDFPKPPFPPQKQSEPGQSTRMDPVPDYGEASYRGADRLRGQIAVITGADSGIGRAVALACRSFTCDYASNSKIILPLRFPCGPRPEHDRFYPPRSLCSRPILHCCVRASADLIFAPFAPTAAAR